MRTLDLLVIDEISMVRADLLDAVDDTLKRYRHSSLPFGGVQLLLIGDLQQLAPVVKDEEWDMLKQFYATPYFSAAWPCKRPITLPSNLKRFTAKATLSFVIAQPHTHWQCQPASA